MPPAPRRLGLGAKFLSHAQAVALSPGEQKLQTQIKHAAAKRGAKEAQKRAGAPGAASSSSSTKPAKPAVDEDSEDSEDEGRTSKFSKKPQRPLPAARPAGVAKQAAAGVPVPLRGVIHKAEQRR